MVNKAEKSIEVVRSSYSPDFLSGKGWCGQVRRGAPDSPVHTCVLRLVGARVGSGAGASAQAIQSVQGYQRLECRIDFSWERGGGRGGSPRSCIVS